MSIVPGFRCLCVLGALLSSASVFAAETSSVEAEGQAAIVDGNRPLARDRATEDALRRAVEQATGTLVSSESLSRGSVLVEDRIYTRARGYVSSYAVLGTSERDGVVAVRVQAEIALGKLSDDLAAIGVLLSRKGMPRVAVLIAEQRIGEQRPAAWWGAHGKDGREVAGALRLDQRVVENTLIGEWARKGFTFVDLDVLAGKVQASGILSTDLSQEQIRELGDLVEADVILLGTAISTKQGNVEDLLDGVSYGSKEGLGVTCSGTVSVRAFNSDDAQILAAGEATSPGGVGQDALGCGRTALKQATAELGKALQRDLLAAWRRDLDAGSKLRLKITGVRTLRTLNALKAALSETVRGVKSVDQKSYRRGSADLDLRIQGTSEAFATAIDAKRIDGHTISVVAISPNQVELELTR